MNFRPLATIFTRRHTHDVGGKCANCGASAFWKDGETHRNYCHDCGSRYISFLRHVKVQLYGAFVLPRLVKGANR